MPRWVKLDEIAQRGDEAVTALRTSSGWLDRQFLYRGKELLDLETTPPGVRRRILDDVERISRLLLLYPLWKSEVGKMIIEARRTRRGKPVRILDIGAGRGGFLSQLGAWARRRRIPVELVGLDNDEVAVEAARRAAYEEGQRITFHHGDARTLEFESGGVDIVLSTFTLHHLTPGDVARVLAEMDRVAAVNYFAFDVRRSLAALPAFYAFLRLGAFEAPTRHDSIASLRRGYTGPEIEALLRSAGVENFSVKTYPPAYLAATRA